MCELFKFNYRSIERGQESVRPPVTGWIISHKPLNFYVTYWKTSDIEVSRSYESFKDN